MPTLLFTSLLLLAASSQSDASEGLRFRASAETVLRKNLLVNHEIALDGVSFSRDGGVPVKQESSGWMSTWFKVTLDDTYLEAADGLPRRFARSYVDLGGGGTLAINATIRSRKFEDRAVLVSPLRERTVDFVWVEDEQDWSRLWRRFDADEFWLAEMHGDMDVLGLLPPGAVKPGQEWQVPIEVARSILAPGGNHLITPRTTNVFGRTIEVGVGGDFAEVLGPDLSGRLLARYQGTREVEGRPMGVIEFEIQGLRSLADRTELWRISAPAEEKREVAKLNSALVEYGLDAKGEALWDLGAGHLHTLELSGEEIYVLSVNKVGGSLEERWEQTQQSDFKGTVKLTYGIAPPPADAPDGTAAKPGNKE